MTAETSNEGPLDAPLSGASVTRVEPVSSLGRISLSSGTGNAPRIFQVPVFLVFKDRMSSPVAFAAAFVSLCSTVRSASSFTAASNFFPAALFPFPSFCSEAKTIAAETEEWRIYPALVYSSKSSVARITPNSLVCVFLFLVIVRTRCTHAKTGMA